MLMLILATCNRTKKGQISKIYCHCSMSLYVEVKLKEKIIFSLQYKNTDCSIMCKASPTTKKHHRYGILLVIKSVTMKGFQFHDIFEHLSPLNHDFCGVFCQDQIPRRLKVLQYAICNTAKSYQVRRWTWICDVKCLIVLNPSGVSCACTSTFWYMFIF